MMWFPESRLFYLSTQKTRPKLVQLMVPCLNRTRREIAIRLKVRQRRTTQTTHNVANHLPPNRYPNICRRNHYPNQCLSPRNHHPEPMHLTEKPPPGHMPVTENPQPEPMPVTEIVSREPEIGPHYNTVWDLEDAKLERITSSTFMSRYRRRSDSSLAMKEPADPSEGRLVADLDVLRAKARATEEVIGVRECGPSDLQRMSFHMNLSASEKEEKASMPGMNSVWESYREAHVRCRIYKQVGCDHMTAAPARVLTETWADQNKAAAMVSAGEISDDEDYLEPSFVRRQQRSRIRREVRAQARSTVARPKTKTTQRSRR
eukprot:594726_1